MKKIFIGCEYSGTVAKAFLQKGYQVTTCDIIPSELEPQENYIHIQGDLLEVLENTTPNSFDIAIFFPPCTYLTSAGLHYCNIKKHKSKAVKRIAKRKRAIDFFLKCLNANIANKVAVENPIGYINAHIIKHTQIIYPYYFGDAEMKRTCLWLINLKPLAHFNTNTLFSNKTHCEKPKPTRVYINPQGKTKREYYINSVNMLKLSKEQRAKERSRFWPGIAKAMADQWS